MPDAAQHLEGEFNNEIKFANYFEQICNEKEMVAPPEFESGSKGPEPSMLGRYTTGLLCGMNRDGTLGYRFFIFSVVIVSPFPGT